LQTAIQIQQLENKETKMLLETLAVITAVKELIEEPKETAGEIFIKLLMMGIIFSAIGLGVAWMIGNSLLMGAAVGAVVGSALFGLARILID
jgi:hypothetical protein